MDAICFVLGLRAKNMRADSIKDFVFRVEGLDEDKQVRLRTLGAHKAVGESQL